MKLSIITITFNAESVLKKTMDSIFCPNPPFDIEYLVIDGKSTDRTIDLVRQFERELSERRRLEMKTMDDAYVERIGGDFSFKWISEPDSGLYDAMNRGLHMATGDFVWFINAGDKIYDRHTYQRIADLLKEKPDCEVIYGQSLIIDHEDRPLGERHKIAPKNLQKKHLLNGLVVCHQSILVKRSIAPDYDLQYKVSADYDWTCKVLSVSKMNGYIDDYISRFMLAGVSSTHRKASWGERFRIMRKHFGLCATLWAHLLIVLKYPFSQKAR